MHITLMRIDKNMKLFVNGILDQGKKKFFLN